MRVQFDHFYTYAELTETLEAWSAEHAQLFRFEAIGSTGLESEAETVGQRTPSIQVGSLRESNLGIRTA